jgi:D-alanyl-D-alanine carboxypeptidase
MFSRRELLLVPAGLLAASRVSAIDQPTHASQTLRTELEGIRRRFPVPALVGLIVTRDATFAEAGCGVRMVGRIDTVSEQAHWQLGSITKTFTATLAAILVERGKLTWDTTLGQIYPEHVGIMAPGVRDITIRHLMTHRSGMMGADAVPWEGVPETNQPSLSLAERRQREIVIGLKAPLSFQPGSNSAYSNQGYVTLGGIAERVDGRSYEELIVSEIAKPLGIVSVVFGEPALAHPEREPWPHVLERGNWRPVPPLGSEQFGYHLANPAGGISLTLAGFARWMQAHLNGETTPSILSRKMFKTIHTEESQGGVPAFAINTRSPAILGRSLAHGGSNGRNSADHLILLDRGVGVFYAMNAAPPENIPTGWLALTTMLATALPDRWPRPASHPPKPDANGVVEGEALQIIGLTAGSVEIQDFANLSKKFQLWWRGAKEGDRLMLRFEVPHRGRYAVDGEFCRAADYGDVTLQLGSIQKRLSFRAAQLGWDRIALGREILAGGPHDLTVTAHGSAGQNGITCHLGLDSLRLQHLGQT